MNPDTEKNEAENGKSLDTKSRTKEIFAGVGWFALAVILLIFGAIGFLFIWHINPFLHYRLGAFAGPVMVWLMGMMDAASNALFGWI